MPEYGERKLREHHVGQVGYRELVGTAAFTTSGTSTTVTVVPLTKIDHVTLVPLNTAATDAVLSVGHAPNTNSGCIEISGTTMNVVRNAAGTATSGLAFQWKVQGR